MHKLLSQLSEWHMVFLNKCYSNGQGISLYGYRRFIIQTFCSQKHATGPSHESSQSEHILTSYLSTIDFNIILPFMPRYLTWSPFLEIYQPKFCMHFPFPHASNMSHTATHPNLSWFNQSITYHLLPVIITTTTTITNKLWH